jgi:D-beta-D-heptose 7-phosphate kinase/D-beta-D-heptose 1-phosphate adenosyltransferase
MLDRSTFGASERDCPEAPVPVLTHRRSHDRPGGAANVAALLAGLGATLDLVGVVGRDDEATTLRAVLEACGVSARCLLADPDRRTTLKARFFLEDQDRRARLLLRVDQEDRHPLSDGIEDGLLSNIDRVLPACDIVLVSDYAKGVCTPRTLAHLIGQSRARRIPVLVDPGRSTAGGPYRGATCLTPNRHEAEAATGIAVATKTDAIRAGRRLLRIAGVESVLVTLDQEGAVLVSRSGPPECFLARPSRLRDPTGAGDTLLAVLGLGLAIGLPWRRAIELAVIAGGLQVERVGVVPVSWEDILSEDAGWIAAPDVGTPVGHARAECDAV